MAETITIGCKLAQGIWLELVTPGEMTQPSQPGPRVRLRGANDLSVRIVSKNPADFPAAFTIVDKSFWDQWVKSPQAKCEWYKKGFVFIAPNDAKGQAAASAEHLKDKTGFEPGAPDAEGKFKDSRLPAGIQQDQDTMHQARPGSVVAA